MYIIQEKLVRKIIVILHHIYKNKGFHLLFALCNIFVLKQLIIIQFGNCRLMLLFYNIKPTGINLVILHQTCVHNSRKFNYLKRNFDLFQYIEQYQIFYVLLSQYNIFFIKILLIIKFKNERLMFTFNIIKPILIYLVIVHQLYVYNLIKINNYKKKINSFYYV